MVAKNFEMGTIVWAKMKGFPSWPAKIIEPPADAKSKKPKTKHHYVCFFGSDNHAWIIDDNIVPHTDSMLKPGGKKRSAALQKAIEALINYQRTSAKPSTLPDNAVIQIEKDSSKRKFTQVVDIVGKNHAGKEVQLSKKVEVDDDGSESSPSPKRSRTNADKCSETDNGVSLDISPSVSSRPSTALHAKSVCGTVKLKDGIINKTFKNGTPTDKKIGFLGLGQMGQEIVMNLLNSGHQVTVWNRSPEKVERFIEAGAHKGMTPADVVAASDITFCCVSDPEAAKAMVFGNWGVLKALKSCEVGGKGYVEMTSIDPDTSRDIAEAVISSRGKYLEAPIIGSRLRAKHARLLILAAGDESLFEDCKTCFSAMGNHAHFLSREIPYGSKMNLIVSMFRGTIYAALSEAMALLEKANLSHEVFIKSLYFLNLSSELVEQKAFSMFAKYFEVDVSLKYVQKDLHLALEVGHSLEQPIPLAAAANEVYKQAKLLGYSDQDVSAVLMSAKHKSYCSSS